MVNEMQIKERRSANYHPTIWEPKLILSLTTPYSYEIENDAAQLEELKQEARTLLLTTEDPCQKLKLIDSMQRLGVAYHFEEEIRVAINQTNFNVTGDLYTTSLHFRLRRQHAFSVTSEVFNKFRGRDGKFMSSLSEDAAGLLSLYEASYLGEEGEDVLEEARKFSRKNLKSLLMDKLKGSDFVAEQVQKSLEIPSQLRMPRIEARNFIHLYSRDDTSSSVLLELAKLDYNMIQSLYQCELKELARWWKNLGFKEKLSFSRDRLMENYLWAMGIIFEPQLSKCRIGITKFVCILSAIDDMYDVYGSLDELELFTAAVKRWDIKAMHDLPDYMKICYLAMFNFANEMAYDVMKEHDVDILTYLVEEWAKLCGSYLVEARWFFNKYTPTLDEYIENAWISIGGHAGIVHAYMLQGCNVTKNSLNYLKQGNQLIYWSSLITRLIDDLGTHKAESMRGDVTKSVGCYMIEDGVSEEEAEDYIKRLINYSWKKLNEEVAKRSLPKFLVNICLNMARTAQCIFQHGDGIGTSNGITKDRLFSLIVQPIPIDPTT